MALGHAPANLLYCTAKPESRTGWLQLLLRFEAWLERRRTARILYQLDDRALADIGLSRADVEGLNDAKDWRDYLPPSFGR